MQLEHSFTVPVGVEAAWTVLLDIERIAPCMPGAAIDSVDGDDFTGTVKVKLGPIGLTYKGKASFVEKDAAAHRAVIDARGRDARGNGTANAKVTATLTEQGASTAVHVVTDLDITGKPAQFGRGVMVDVGNKLIGQFAECLAGKLTDGGDMSPAESPAAAPATEADDGEAATSPSGGAHAAHDDEQPGSNASPTVVPARPTSVPRPAEVEPINLIESAGPAIAKRVAPLAAVAVLLFLVLRRWAKR
jgi:carbon monoxide dehydrogenase subunit G